MILSGRAALAGVLGWPVSHSKSPRLHGYWLERHGIDGAYLPLPVAPENFAQAVRALVDLGFRGANVTVPHKEEALALALADEADDNAKRIGAANTLVFRDGRIVASNTDGFGFFANLEQGAPSWRPQAPALVLGAGGAARAVIVALLDSGCRELRLCNRTAARAEVLRDTFGGSVTVVPWEEREAALTDLGLLVNTTSLGMEGQPPLSLDLARLSASAVVNDLVYAPLETPLLAAARRQGNPAVDGLGMLLHQARPGFEAWFGVRPEVDAALRDFVLAG